jgi:hypothetical protein
VAERAIAEASSSGIDFFALDWWPTRPEQNRRIDTGFLRAPNLSSMRFAIFYETGDLGAPVPYQSITELTPAARAHLVADMVQLARTYFANPQYLRIGGRPVVFWYVTRTLTGDVAAAVQEVRSALRSLGFDLFIVGDEISWRVTSEAGVGTTDPQPERPACSTPSPGTTSTTPRIRSRGATARRRPSSPMPLALPRPTGRPSVMRSPSCLT